MTLRFSHLFPSHKKLAVDNFGGYLIANIGGYLIANAGGYLEAINDKT